MRSTSAAIMMLGVALCRVGAEDHKDEFNRPDTDWASVGSALDGSSEAYTISRGRFRIEGGSLLSDPDDGQEKEILVEHLQSRLESGGKFEASVDFCVPESSEDVAVGIAFNYTMDSSPPGPRRFCAVRFRDEETSQYLQFLEVTSTETLRGEAIARNFEVQRGHWYTLSVRSEDYPLLEFTLKEAGADGQELTSGRVNLTGTQTVDGALGLHVTGRGGVRLDNFSASAR